jgi:hypothetical protein
MILFRFCLSEIMLTEKWPTHKEVQTLKQKLQGSLTTSNGQESWESHTLAVIKCGLPEDCVNIYKIPPEQSQLLQQEQPALCNTTWICIGHQYAILAPKNRLPIDFSGNNNMAGVVISNIIKEETSQNSKLPLITPSLPKSNNQLLTPTTQTQIAASLLI